MEEILKMKPDRQLSGMSGEFLVVGKLFKLGLQASLTLGNAKSVDIFVHNPFTRKNYAVQVKTLRQRNVFIIDKGDLDTSNIYIFVCLNDFEEEENFFLVSGSELLDRRVHFFGEKEYTIPGINYSSLKPFENNWRLFFSGMSDIEIELFKCHGTKTKQNKVLKKFGK